MIEAARSETGTTLAMVGVLAAAVSVAAYMAFDNWAAEEVKRDWGAVEGPACPMVRDLSRPPFGAKGPQTFDYGGASFARRYGHVYCVAPTDGPPWDQQVYRVCQFSAPTTVGVIRGGETWLFKPGVGRAATVTVRRGEVRCVIGGWFKG